MAFNTRKPKTPASPFEAERKAAQRKALRALGKAQRAADLAGVPLSEWEGEFLGSVAERVKTHGRAFADPDKGSPGQALSALQARKLKEIVAKAKGETKGEGRPQRRFGRPPPPPRDAAPEEED